MSTISSETEGVKEISATDKVAVKNFVAFDNYTFCCGINEVLIPV